MTKNAISVIYCFVIFIACGCNTTKLDTSHSSRSAESTQYDIVIYGGTSAGVIAAYTAKKMGTSVLLIEPSEYLGGLSSGGLGKTDIGNKYAITGLSRDFYRSIGKHYGKFEQWNFEPHVAKTVFEDYIVRAEIKVLYLHRIVGVEKNGNVISKIIVENSESPAESDHKSISGKMFIDCSYEGDLMARSGASYTYGREANSQYNETYNGVQMMGGHQFPDGVDPFKIRGDSTSGLLWGMSEEMLQADGTRDRKQQAYNFRICLTDDPENSIPISRPENYDSTKYELLARLFESQPTKRLINDYFIWSSMPNNKSDINNRGGFSTDMIGSNHDFAEADYVQRKKIVQDHIDYTKGLLYFYTADPRVPKELSEKVQKWGYPKDEYVDNEHWSPQLYLREVRRLVGEYVMTQANCVGETVVKDGIAMAAYTMDSHNCQRIVIEKDGKKMVKNEGNVEIGGFGPYPISYRSMIPKASEVSNLLVPVALSASHIAYGSIRMEPVFMALAQAAAVAAVIGLEEGKTVQEVDTKKLQNILKSNPLADNSTPDILIDNEDSLNVRTKGDWEIQKNGGYGPNLLYTNKNTKDVQSVQFIPEVSKAAFYNIYAYFTRVKDSSVNTHIEVFDGAELSKVIVNQGDILKDGQSSGEWVFLGTFRLPEGDSAYVQISDKNADGIVVADAVLCVIQDD